MKPWRKATFCKPCQKSTYHSQSQALRVLLRAAGRSGDALRIYHCPIGSGYHLTKLVLS
jgi:hypothetical protein